MSEKSLTLMDGAMGTMLLSQGIPVRSCLESLNASRPELISKIHRSYVEAGAQILVTNTFGANRIRLRRKRMAEGLEKFNRLGVELARRAAPSGVRVFASVGPLGPEARLLSNARRREQFLEQVRALEREGPDGWLVETMTSLDEAVAASQAIREVSDRDLFVLMTFPSGPRGHSNLRPKRLESIAIALRRASADVIGANCGLEPEEATLVLEALRKVDPGPFCARPAAGPPDRPVPPEEFAGWGLRLKRLGVQWIGGCCGSTPAHIRELKSVLSRAG